MKELYEQYLNSKTSNSLEDRIEVMNNIIRQHPKLMDYIQTKIDSCYGTHKVYLVHMKVNGEDMLKVGYTKNSVEGRFGEKRYAGRDNLEIVEILRQGQFQAKGAIDFEKVLKSEYKNFKVKTDLTLPGKGEFYSIDYKDIMLERYDLLSGTYKNTFGLKAPN
jgi:hypothetical protein